MTALPAIAGRNELSANKLAIDGGIPAVCLPLPAWPPRSKAITDSVYSCLQDGSWGQYQGRPLQELIELLQLRLGVARVWPCSSGTIGVELALRGCGVRPGQEVILAGYDFPGNFRAIESIGALPVLVDVRDEGWTASSGAIANAITDETAAVLVSHLHGELVDMASLISLCRGAGLRVVEDACQVPGAIVNGKAAGCSGDVGVFSFGGSKLLTAGRGGAVITDQEEIWQRIKIAADRGNDAWPLSSLQAAALLPQLDMLERANQFRLQSARRIREAVETSQCLRTITQPWTDQLQPAFYKFPLLLPQHVDRTWSTAALQAEGIPADSGFRGFLRRAPRRCRASFSLANSQVAAEQTILLHHPCLLAEDALIGQLITGLEKIDASIACRR